MQVNVQYRFRLSDGSETDEMNRIECRALPGATLGLIVLLAKRGDGTLDADQPGSLLGR